MYIAKFWGEYNSYPTTVIKTKKFLTTWGFKRYFNKCEWNWVSFEGKCPKGYEPRIEE